MAYKTFVALDPLPASEVMTYLMKQAVIVCTSSTRPSSPVEGMHIYQTDTDTVAIYNGSAWVEVTPESAAVATAEAIASASYTDLATPGPAVTLNTGTKALVIVGAAMTEAAPTGQQVYTSFAVSGATTRAPADTEAACVRFATGGASVGLMAASFAALLTGLTAGANTFTMKYKSATAVSTTWANRHLTVFPLP